MPTQPGSHEPLLRVRGLNKRYVRGGLWRKRVSIPAVNDVSLEIFSGQTMALVGESGSGKSTVARCVARIEEPDSGQILLGDGHLGSEGSTTAGTEVQLVFQDPSTSMNPRLTAGEVVEEPLLIQGQPAPHRKDVVLTVLKEVGVPASWMERSVMDFSGGQRQRLAIARALAVRPQLLVLDEALTGLDLSTQAQIVNLLLDLQAAHSLTYLLISHDLGLVARMADAIAVMAGGRIVETGLTQEILSAPRHQETVKLAEAARAAQGNLMAITGASA